MKGWLFGNHRKTIGRRIRVNVYFVKEVTLKWYLISA
jgi:hypothetical protein